MPPFETVPYPQPQGYQPYPGSGGPPTNQDLWNYYQNIADQSQSDYQNILQQYQKLANQSPQFADPNQYYSQNFDPSSFLIPSNPNSASSIFGSYYGGGGNFNPISAPTMAGSGSSAAFNQFQELANTGGYSQGDLANIRARGLSPIQSVYDLAQSDISRQKNLAGGYSPNSAALEAKMARGLSGQLSEASQNIEGQIAPMVHAGKLAGLEGLSAIEESRLARELDVGKFNTQMKTDTDKFNSAMQQQMQDMFLQALLADQQNITNVNTKNQDLQAQMMLANKQNQMEVNKLNEQAKQAYNQQLLDLQNQKLAALAGQGNLYGTTSGQVKGPGADALDNIKTGIDYYKASGGPSKQTGSPGGIYVGGGGFPTSPTNQFPSNTFSSPSNQFSIPPGSSSNYAGMKMPKPGSSF